VLPKIAYGNSLYKAYAEFIAINYLTVEAYGNSFYRAYEFIPINYLIVETTHT